MLWTESPDRWVLWFQICIYYHHLTQSHFNALLQDWLKYLLLGEGKRLLGLKSWKWKLLRLVRSLVNHGQYSPWNSPGQNIRVDRLSLLQGILRKQGWSPGISHWRWILHQLSHNGSQRMLEWVAYPFSTKTSLPWNWTDVFSFAGRIFPKWAIRKVLRWAKSGG